MAVWGGTRFGGTSTGSADSKERVTFTKSLLGSSMNSGIHSFESLLHLRADRAEDFFAGMGVRASLALLALRDRGERSAKAVLAQEHALHRGQVNSGLLQRWHHCDVSPTSETLEP